jgi:hypothetical protein
VLRDPKVEVGFAGIGAVAKRQGHRLGPKGLIDFARFEQTARALPVVSQMLVEVYHEVTCVKGWGLLDVVGRRPSEIGNLAEG